MIESELFETGGYERNSNIMFLAKNIENGEIRLMSYRTDPWLNDKEKYDEDEKQILSIE